MILKDIVTQFLPNADKAEMILQFNIPKRKKEYLASADKLFAYIENYIGVFKALSALSSKFEFEVLN